jgi:hypothetical protein
MGSRLESSGSKMSQKMENNFSVTFDRATVKISDKIWNFTLHLVKKVLENVGMDEGEWLLKMPHRVRKKGLEKFQALRLVDYGTLKAVRVRCKPRGNETCFEYTLVPPVGIDINLLFNLLQRVHPRTLEIHDTLAMAAATYYPETREISKFSLRPLPPLPPKTDWTVGGRLSPQAEISKEKPKSENQFNKKEILSDVTPKQSQIDLKLKNTPSVEEEKTTSNGIEKISSLAIKEAILFSDQEVMDRALIAISFVSEGGYAKKSLASESMINNLEINNFIKKYGVSYKSVPGAMRALTMGLKKNNYIEQIYYGMGSESVRGYELTEKGIKRICALKKFLCENLIQKMNHNWSADVEENFSDKSEATSRAISDIESSQEIESSQVEKYSKLESLVASLKESNDQIVDANSFIENLNSEKNDLAAELFGVDLAIQEQNKIKEEIERRINKFKEKQKEIKKQIEVKEKEIEDWRLYLVPYVEEKDRLKKEIEKLANLVGIGLQS